MIDPLRTLSGAVALALGILLAACDAPPGVMTPRYRFVDPDLRRSGGGASEREPALAEGELGTRAGSAVRIPLATIDADTRYVLFGYLDRVLVSRQPVEVPESGRLTFLAPVADAFRESEQLALLPFVHIAEKWESLPAVAAEVEVTEGGRVVSIPLEFSETAANPVAELYVQAYPVPSEASTSYRTPEVEIPRRAVLEFSIGVLDVAWHYGPVEFSLSACDAAECSSLFTETLDPSQAQNQGWMERSVSLESLAGKRRAFLFETQHRGSEPEAFSLPAWANPTIWAPAPGALSTPNLILISLDTLSATHLSLYGYERETAPFLEQSLAAQGTVVENFVAASTSTAPSHMTLFTSLPPCAHGVTEYVAALPTAVPTLAQILRDHGYETAAVTENAALTLHGGFARGFSTYKENQAADSESRKGRVKGTFDWGRGWLQRSKGRRFFLFLHTYQVHHPYTPPSSYEGLFQVPEDPSKVNEPGGIAGARMRAKYDREIRYVDDEIRSLVADLREEGVTKDTIFVILSDHGEEFFEHGGQGHGGGLYREVLQVPLIFWGPGIPSGRRVQRPVRHIDLLPTLLELAGVPAPEHALGTSFLPLILGSGGELDSQVPPIFSSSWSRASLKARGAQVPSFSVQIGGRKLVRYLTKDGYRYEYFDVSRDPDETDDLYTGATDETRSLEALLDEYIAANRALHRQLTAGPHRPISKLGTEADLHPNLEEKLRALGYLK